MNRKTRTLYTLAVVLAVGPLDTGCDSSDNIVSPPEQWVLTMADEFDSGTSPSTELWAIETGYGGEDNGWGNDEWQLYTDSPDNVRVEGGNLVITAQCPVKPCGKRDGSITSARLKTQDRFEQEHGRFEARIKLPEGQGLWPAFWMLGANIEEVPWPGCGEIDIMEYQGQRPKRIFGSLHGPGYSGGGAISGDFELPDATFDATTEQAKTGDWSGNVLAPGPSTSPVIQQANMGVGIVTPNSKVTISFALLGELTGESGAVFAELFSEVSGGGGKSEILRVGPLVPTGQWNTYSYTVTTGDDVSGGLTLELKAECGAVPGCAANAYFDDVTITAGAVELATNGGFETGNTDGWTFFDNSGTFADDFHVFAVDWDPGRITISVDDEVYNIVRSAQVSSRGDWVFNNEFFALLNLAVGGTLGGSVVDPDAFPAEVLIDYVRIFERAQ